MSIEVLRESVDYLWAVARQIDRVVEYANRVFDPEERLPEYAKLRRLAASVRHLLRMVRPLLRHADAKALEEYDRLLARYTSLLRNAADGRVLGEAYRTVLDIFENLVAGLYQEGLLVRVSRLAIEG